MLGLCKVVELVVSCTQKRLTPTATPTGPCLHVWLDAFLNVSLIDPINSEHKLRVVNVKILKNQRSLQ